MLYIGSDHGGYKLKEQLVKYLDSVDEPYKDLGAYDLDEKDDYPDFAGEVARYTRLERGDLGVIICRSGIGSCIVANKYRDVRAALCCDEKMAKMAREHNGANVMCMGADFVDFETAKKMLMTFIQTPFSMEERHVRRLNKVLDQDEKIQG